MKHKRKAYGVPLRRSAPLKLVPHPDRPENEDWRRWALNQDRPLAVDLFSGAGGLSLGLEEIGYRVALAVDHDPHALETHRHNFPGLALDLDLSDPERVSSLAKLLVGLPIDLIAGGPPCQPFSRAGSSKIRSLVEQGSRDDIDPRRELWRSFVQVVRAVKPRAVLMENVPDMAFGDDLRTIRSLLEELREAGYSAEARLVNAALYGVPQHRQRLIVIGISHGSSFDWPLTSRPVKLRAAIADLPDLLGSYGEAEMRYDLPATAFQRRARQGMEGARHVVWDHVTRAVRDDDREAFNLMDQFTLYADLPARLRRYRADTFDDKYHRLGWNELSRSITAHIAKDGYWYIHPREARTLTVREAARIQTFPDRFRFAGNRSHQFAQIGNAVPPALAAALGRELLRGRHRLPDVLSVRDRLYGARTPIREWASQRQQQQPWRFPGSPWAVLVAAVLDPRSKAHDMVKGVLGMFPRPGSVSRAAFLPHLRALGVRRERAKRLEKLARQVVRTGNWEKLVAGSGGLGVGERKTFAATGLGGDTVVATAASARVVARVSGENAAAIRSRAKDRMLIGHVVGKGPDAPWVNAAIHVLGTDVCRPAHPLCGQCPIADLCLTHRSRETKGLESGAKRSRAA